MASSAKYKIVELVTIEGNKLPKCFLDVKDSIDSFKVRNDDIWLTSYPKSGTTWTQELIWLLENDLDYQGAKQPIEKRFPFLEYCSILQARDAFSKANNIRLGFEPTHHLKNIEEMGRRFIKTHLHWDLLPSQIRDGSKSPKIIHIMRDPKQVVVSYYHHATEVFPFYIGDLPDFVDLFIKGEVPFGDYFNNVMSYWSRKTLPNLLIITYEDMKNNLGHVIKNVADFLGKSLTWDNIDKLEKHLSFEAMKINQAVNKQHVIKDDRVKFMRKGTVDSFKEELDEELIEKLDYWVQENARGTGLPYHS